MLRPLGKGMYIALVGLLATACAPRSQYMGLDLRPGSAIASDVRALAERARSGDKQAQLELGGVFEEGRGTPRDITKAKALYRAAASPSGGPVWVYLPPPGPGLSGRVMQVGNQPVRAGLVEARRRLEVLHD